MNETLVTNCWNTRAHFPHTFILFRHLQGQSQSQGQEQESAPLCCGFSACGAGAGGFLVCILKRGRTIAELRESVSQYCQQQTAEQQQVTNFSVHEIAVDHTEGICVRDQDGQEEEK
jgi:hypothetical protein